MTDFPDLKIKALVNFPSNALGGIGVEVAKVDGNFVIDLAYEDFAPPVGGVSDPTHQNVLLWNDITQDYTLTPISLFGGGGGIPDAPNDGTQYGRQSAAWTPIVASGGGTPSNTSPVMDGTAAPGVATAYSRGDHVHPSDTSKAAISHTHTASQVTDFSEAVDDRVGSLLVAGTNVTLNYNDAGNTLTINSTAGGGGSGDVVGPASAVNNNFAAFNLTTGKLIKDSGSAASSFATPASVTTAIGAAAIRYDAAQGLTSAQQKQGRANAGVNDANIIVNGDFRINQMAYASGAALAAGIYGHDQWKAGASGGDYSFTQLKSSTQITIAAGKSLIQPIEDVNVVGGSYVLSWTGTAQARAGVNTLTPSGSYAASPLSITGQTAGTVMSVEFNAGTLGTVKLEVGTIATPFVMRPYDQELLACERYFRQFGGGNPYEAFAVGQAVSATTATYLLFLIPIMRGAPSLLSLIGAFGTAAANSAVVALSGMTQQYSTPSVSYLIGTAASGLVAGDSTILSASNDTTARIRLDARL